jgi:hemerythrin
MINFPPELLTGVASIDEQHMELIKYINKILMMGANAANQEELDKLLLFLGNYAVKHFSDEEKIQLQVGYPKYEEHRQMHLKFIEDYMELMADYREKGPSVKFMVELDQAVIRWILHHIQEADLDIGVYIKENNIEVG